MSHHKVNLQRNYYINMTHADKMNIFQHFAMDIPLIFGEASGIKCTERLRDFLYPLSDSQDSKSTIKTV